MFYRFKIYDWFSGWARLTVAAAVTLALLSGCIPPPTVQGESVQKDINYLLAVNQGLRKKVSELEGLTRQMAKDVEETKRGLAALSVETKSVLAESNADFERFLEEFSFVQGGAQETAHVRQRFREEIAFLKQEQLMLRQRLEEIKSTTVKEKKTTDKTDKELKEDIEKLMAGFATLDDRVEELDKRAGELARLTSSVEGRIEDLEPLVLKTGKGAAGSADLSPALKILFTDPKALYTEGYKQVMSKDYTGGAETLKAFLSRFPKHELADNAQYWLAETYYNLGEWERAVLEFNKVSKNYPKGDKVPSALLKQGMAFSKIGANKEARVILQRLIDKYPDSAETEKAKEQLKKLRTDPAG